MSQSLSQIFLHIVFSTKERRPFLQDTSPDSSSTLRLRKNTIAMNHFKMSSDDY
jgi:hypothetical protein